MSRRNKKEVWAEMARRKVILHKDEKWDKIDLWGLFNWGEIKRFLERGDLISYNGRIPEGRGRKCPIWVIPSKEMWEKEIKPLIEKHTLNELTTMAGRS